MKLNNLKWALIIFTVSINQLNAKTDPIQVNGNLVDKINQNKSLMPQEWENLGEGTIYIDPTNNQRGGFLNQVYIPLYDGDYVTSATNAENFGYRLLEFTDNTDQQTYYILERDPQNQLNNFWGTYVYNPNPKKSQLIIQSPHPDHDTYTDRLGAYVFREVGARLFFMSGAHRANSSVPSGCSGTSNVANDTISGNAPPPHFLTDAGSFRVADVAHNANTMFHALTEWTFDQHPTAFYFIQLHGFGRDIDPHVVLSNGRDEGFPAPANDHLMKLRTEIGNYWDALSQSGITLDIEVAHDDGDNNFGDLLAMVNTQGRYINGSNNPCTSAPNQNTGHFLHLELGKKDDDYFLRDVSNFEILAKAIESTFTFPPPDWGIPNFKVGFDGNNEMVELGWKTNNENGNRYFEIQRAINDTTAFRPVGIVVSHGDAKGVQTYQWSDRGLNYDGRTKVYYRLKFESMTGYQGYSKIAKVKKRKPKRLKFLYNNRGTGKNVKVNIPKDIPGRSTVQLSIINPKTGFSLKRELQAEAVRGFLRRRLPTYPAGVYAIKLKYRDIELTDKYLRL